MGTKEGKQKKKKKRKENLATTHAAATWKVLLQLVEIAVLEPVARRQPRKLHSAPPAGQCTDLKLEACK